MQAMRAAVLTAALLALLGAGWACLITNCPRGGKRSGPHTAALGPARGRECVSCGPAGEGVCVGPGICCGPLFGCVLAAHQVCARAEAFPPHCSAPPAAASAAAGAGVPLGAPCGADLTPDGSAPGRCAAQGVCCTHDSCRLDAVCLSGAAGAAGAAREDSNEVAVAAGLDPDFLLSSLRRLAAGGAN